MSYAYGAYGPYAPYGAYGALSPYDVNALGLVQAYRAMGTKDSKDSKENDAPKVVSNIPSAVMSPESIKALIKDNVNALQKTCQGCPPEYEGQFHAFEKRLAEISNKLEADRLPPQVIATLKTIVSDIQSLQRSRDSIVETQNHIGDALETHKVFTTNSINGIVCATREELFDVNKEISNVSSQIGALKTLNNHIAEINTKVQKLEASSEQQIPVAPAMQVNNGVQSVINSVEQRIEQMHLTTPSACDIRTAILQYHNGTMHSLTFEQLAQIIQEESGSNIELLEKEKTVRTFLLRFIEKYINKITAVPTYVDKLIDRDEITRKQDIISAFIRVIDKSADDDITRYPCLLLYFLFQFETGKGGEQSFKVFRT